MTSRDTHATPWSLDSYPLILGAVIVGSALLMFALGLDDSLPDPPTDAQILAARTHLDSVCDSAGVYGSCPVYEIVVEAAPAPVPR
jgi:hypothetical protein